ncbi:hypothetical protein [Hoylesella nanceiensis]|uniref:hypothetical protein n=1 Tax=Hoylesella nanceiensis TaxID=425941 RepID=UPI0028D07736|nr:hypothetical protein [Hoylesella nanceiensis]
MEALQKGLYFCSKRTKVDSPNNYSNSLKERSASPLNTASAQRSFKSGALTSRKGCYCTLKALSLHRKSHALENEKGSTLKKRALPID